MNKKITASCLSLALALGLFSTTALAAEEPSQPVETGEAVVQSQEVTEPTPAAEESGVKEVDITSAVTSYVINEPTKLIVSEDVTLSGTGDAFTIKADTELVFENDATLTLSGYANGFVVSGAALTSEDMQITANSEMDVFRLKAKAELHLSGENDIQGCGKVGTANRAIVLESTPVDEGQTVTLAANSTLHANNFYRGMETGSAKDYTISGAGMESSVFDFSNNDCGIALSYFDQDANFKDCKLEVSNCTTSGIFMRQDNASLNGLYIDNVFINCVNDEISSQGDIAIRFHTVKFSITNSKINIENAWNTGLWIFDGWDRSGQKEISNTEITIKNVEESPNSSVAGAAMRRKAITFVPYGDWLIKNCTITMEGNPSDPMEGGLNIGNGMVLNRNGFSYTARPTMYGGTLKLEDTSIYTENISRADVGVQIGQFLNIGNNVVIKNDHDTNEKWNESDYKHYTILCDWISDKYAGTILGINIRLSYDITGMAEEYQVDDRVVVMGGSYWSDPDNFEVMGIDAYDSSIPVNQYGEKLTMFQVSEEAYSTYVTDDSITLLHNDGNTTYVYQAQRPSDGTVRYIWAPAVTVTFGQGGEQITVPRGTPFGLTGILPNGTWTYCGEEFTESTVITDDITVTAQ